MSRMPVSFDPRFPTYAISRDRFGVMECCKLRFQFQTWGTVRLWSTDMMGQGTLSEQSWLGEYTGPTSHATGFKKFLVVKFPVVIVPPEGLGVVTPLTVTVQPVGTLPGPNALLKATNDCQLTVSNINPPPPRRTVRPLPVMSQAKPPRGPKFL